MVQYPRAQAGRPLPPTSGRGTASRLCERPAGPRLDGHHDHRAVQDLTCVLWVLAPEQFPVRCVVLAGSLDRRGAVRPRPPQLPPVVGILIGEEADERALGYVPQP